MVLSGLVGHQNFDYKTFLYETLREGRGVSRRELERVARCLHRESEPMPGLLDSNYMLFVSNVDLLCI